MVTLIAILLGVIAVLLAVILRAIFEYGNTINGNLLLILTKLDLRK